MLSVLLRRDHGLLWVAALVSGIGNFVLLAALPYFVYSISGSALASGGALIREMAPMALLPAFGGIVLQHFGLNAVVVIDSAGFILSGMLVVGVTVSLESPRVGEPAGPSLARRTWRDLGGIWLVAGLIAVLAPVPSLRASRSAVTSM
jgi:hypothetical protein